MRSHLTVERFFSSVEGEGIRAGMPTYFLVYGDGSTRLTKGQSFEWCVLSECPHIVLDVSHVVFEEWCQYIRALVLELLNIGRWVTLELRGDQPFEMPDEDRKHLASCKRFLLYPSATPDASRQCHADSPLLGQVKALVWPGEENALAVAASLLIPYANSHAPRVLLVRNTQDKAALRRVAEEFMGNSAYRGLRLSLAEHEWIGVQ